VSALAKESDWLTVQFFLEPEGVCEVSVDRTDYTRVRCSCPARKPLSKCRHIAHVLAEVKREGTYSIRVPDTFEDYAIDALMDDPESFRHMLAHSARVIVLDR